MSHEISFVLDGEQEITSEHELTPNFIISEFGNKDPQSNYLVQLKGNHKVSYQDEGNDPIKIHNNIRFHIISLGPTPVSDSIAYGLDGFLTELRSLGYDIETVDTMNRRVVFPYNVETGKHANTNVKIGLEVPADFPLVPPAGPHVTPRIHKEGVSAPHPTGNINKSPNFGSEWQYWSRPFPDWAKSKMTVAAYMAHIWNLWNSQ